MGNLIFLVAFTAILLIILTYAWFSTQDYDVNTPRKNVIPTEMIPASTIAKEEIVSKDVVDSGNTDLTIYREK